MADEKTEMQKLEEELSYKRKSGWERWGLDKIAQIDAVSKEYMDYISYCKTERLAIERSIAMLDAAGFRPIDACSSLKEGDKVYMAYRGKNLIAAVIGQKGIEAGFNIVASHVDAPRLDLKPNPLYEDGEFALMKTHYYGGIKKYQWFNIPLSLIGVVALKDGSVVNISIGEKPDDPIFMIPDLLPHLAHKVQGGKKLFEAFAGEQLNIIVGSRPVDDEKVKEKIKLSVLDFLHKTYGVKEPDFLSAELEVVPSGPARELGMDRALIAGYGHDDRICGYTNLWGLLNAKDPAKTAVAFLADKEEIGSVGSTGMDSVFFYHGLSKIVNLAKPGISELEFRELLAMKSAALSTDVNAGINPMFKEVHEPNNAARIGYGPAFAKYTGSRGKGGSNDADAEYLARLRELLDSADIPWQIAELGKVDEGGGGTVAYLLARHGIFTIDMGVALLSMHSPAEIASKLDVYATAEANRVFLERF